MKKFAHTTIAFANLRKLTTKEQLEYDAATPETDLVDSYGYNTAKNNLYLYQIHSQNTAKIDTYLLPNAKIQTGCSPRLVLEVYDRLTLIENIEFFNISIYPNEAVELVHKSDFIQCYATKNYGTIKNMLPLSDEWYPEGTLAYSEFTIRANYHANCWILKEDSRRPYQSWEYFHKDDDESLIWSDFHGDYLNKEDAQYPEEDLDTPYHIDSLYYNEYADTYHTSREAANQNTIRDYHSTPQGTFYTKGKLNDPADVLANYTIGFEVEKSSIDGNAEEGSSHDYEDLFVGWETDSSCGVEGITHIYGLNNYKLFEAHVNSSYYVNEEADRKCGGHINISDQTNRIRFWHIKNWVGLWYAMYRNRLTNEYASSNKKACPYIAKSGPKYQAIREKTLRGNQTLYELRLPSRVNTGHQLLRRFRLCQSWVKCLHEYANEDWSYTNAKYDDKYWGTPNWALEYIKESDQALAERIAKKTADLLSEVVSKPTALRMRYLIEQSKDELLQSYKYGSDLLHVIQLTYAFQAYCEIPDTEGHSAKLHEYIQAYI